MIVGIEADHANKEKRSGVENVCYYLIENLKKVIPNDVKVILYSRSPLQGSLAVLPENWESRVLSWWPRKFWSQLRLCFELFFHPPDVFFAPAQLIPFWPPKRTVTLVHDSAFLTLPEAYGFLSRVYLILMNKLVVLFSDKIIVTADFNKKELQKNYSIKEEKIFVVPLAYDKKVFNQKEQELVQRVRDKYSIFGEYLLSVGRLEEKKNTGLIIKSFDKIREAGKIDSLVLVGRFGKGVTGQEVKRVYESAKNKKDIKIIDYVEESDLALLFSGAKLFMFPSRYEGFGLPILEAFASGCPVVVADNSAMAEVAGGAALIAKTNDLDDLTEKAIKIIDNPDFRQELVFKGVKRVENFSWQASAAEIWGILNKILPKH